jgi:hypothetical protein
MLEHRSKIQCRVISHSPDATPPFTPATPSTTQSTNPSQRSIRSHLVHQHASNQPPSTTTDRQETQQSLRDCKEPPTNCDSKRRKSDNNLGDIRRFFTNTSTPKYSDNQAPNQLSHQKLLPQQEYQPLRKYLEPQLSSQQPKISRPHLEALRHTHTQTTLTITTKTEKQQTTQPSKPNLLTTATTRPHKSYDLQLRHNNHVESLRRNTVSNATQRKLQSSDVELQQAH